MTEANEIPVLQRPFFFTGQQLRAGDLDAVTAYHRELSWLHNRSLHNWGIATGYAVTGAAGDSAVVISPGFALDCQGRELILTEAQTIPVPAVAGNATGGPAAYFLTASWLDDSDIDPETRVGVCGTSGAVRRPERVNLRWQDPDDRLTGSAFRPGLDVVLASVEVAGCRLAADASGAQRRNAMPEETPYIYSGQTAAGDTGWRPWPDEENPIGVVATVSTTEAGFGAPPAYHAHVVGRRLLDTDSGDVLIDGYPHVAAAGAGSFELRVVLPMNGGSAHDGEAVAMNPVEIVTADGFAGRLDDELNWYVMWVGIEGG